jgi:hypothetical protein
LFHQPHLPGVDNTFIAYEHIIFQVQKCRGRFLKTFFSSFFFQQTTQPQLMNSIAQFFQFVFKQSVAQQASNAQERVVLRVKKKERLFFSPFFTIPDQLHARRIP